MKYMLTQLMPCRVLQHVRCYLQRECRETADMKVRTYYNHLIRINKEEIPALPPFQPNQLLGNDELLDIVPYGTPRSWQWEMDRQGWDPLDHDINKVIDFMERIKEAEDFDEKNIQE